MDDPIDHELDRDADRVKRAAETLGEYFDAVHIFATRLDGTEAVNISYGTGNFFSRYGQIRLWVIREDESTRDRVRKDLKD